MVDLQGTFTATQVVDANGNAVIRIQPNAIIIWVIRQVSIEMITPGNPNSPVPAAGKCVLRKNGYLLSPLVPTADTASGDPPIWITPADVLSVEWSNCTPGDLARVMAIYDTEAYR